MLPFLLPCYARNDWCQALQTCLAAFPNYRAETHFSSPFPLFPLFPTGISNLPPSGGILHSVTPRLKYVGYGPSRSWRTSVRFPPSTFPKRTGRLRPDCPEDRRKSSRVINAAHLVKDRQAILADSRRKSATSLRACPLSCAMALATASRLPCLRGAPRQRALPSAVIAPVLAPPCMRHRPLGMAGARQGWCVRLLAAPHRGAALAQSSDTRHRGVAHVAQGSPCTLPSVMPRRLSAACP